MILLDKIIISLLIVFFLSGWFKGFLRALIGPIAFLFCFLSAIIFYDLNNNILLTTVIMVVGTVALTIALSVFLSIGLTTVNKEYRGKIFLVSRILGSTLNVFWNGNIMFIIIFFLSALPAEGTWIGTMQKQIPDSKVMNLYSEKVVAKDNRFQAFVNTLAVTHDQEQIDAIAKTKNYQEFIADPKVQAFINDINVINALESKDLIALLKTPSLQALVTNDDSMGIFTRLVERIYDRKLIEVEQPASDYPPTQQTK